MVQHPADGISDGRSRALSRHWRDVIIFAALMAVSLATGLLSASHSSYWSTAQIFEDFMNSPLRILFPVAVALSAGLQTVEEVSNRFIASTRTRVDIRRWLTRRLGSVCLRLFVMFALVTLVDALTAFVIVPAIWPHVVDPAGYGLHSAAAIREADVSVAPLAALLRFGPVSLSVAAAAWFGVNAAVFGVVTVVAVFLIRRPVIALLFPLCLYLLESVAFQLFGIPGPSFLISAVYPAGLQHYALLQAVIPTVCLAAVATGSAAWIVARSRTNPRVS